MKESNFEHICSLISTELKEGFSKEMEQVIGLADSQQMTDLEFRTQIRVLKKSFLKLESAINTIKRS